MPPRKRGGDSFVCPHCGATVAAGASFCRACGASEESGWGDKAELADYEADDDFDYDDYLAREFPDQAPHGRRDAPRRWLVALVVVLLGLALVLWTLGR